VDALRTAGLPITFAGEGRVRLEPAPRLGEDTDAVLDALAGYGKEVIAELRREGAL
jgi:crotonobetainyl-CoA:carnitine CoA-transferase CaiB-like acyl-CoA transferase